MFEAGAQAMRQRRGQPAEVGLHFRRLRIEEDHAVRVADGGADDPQAQARDRNLFIRHLARRAGDADIGAEKREPPHVHGDLRTLGVQHIRRHRTAGRQDAELRAGRQAAIPQIARKDTQPVAALLELAAVRVEQAQGQPHPQPLFLAGEGLGVRLAPARCHPIPRPGGDHKCAGWSPRSAARASRPGPARCSRCPAHHT